MPESITANVHRDIGTGPTGSDTGASTHVIAAIRAHITMRLVLETVITIKNLRNQIITEAIISPV